MNKNLFLGFEIFDCHPIKYIDEAIEKISSKHKNLFFKIRNSWEKKSDNHFIENLRH
jgi:hypothetical protein